MAGGKGEYDIDDAGKPCLLGTSDEPTTGQHLYLIFDDWPWGYSIRKLNLPLPLPPRSPHHHQPGPVPVKRLLPPCICLEATRRHPLFFAAVGTNIIAAHTRNDFFNAPVPECILPVFDVRSLGVRFGPGLLCPAFPHLHHRWRRRAIRSGHGQLQDVLHEAATT